MAVREGLDSLLQSYVDSGLLPVVSVRIWRKGVACYAFDAGFMHPGQPVRTDAIYRICSLSKLITAVAMMQLVEKGKLSLKDPVYRYLPSFARRRILQQDPSGKVRLAKEKRPCLVEHLLTMTSGIPNYDLNTEATPDGFGYLYKQLRYRENTSHPMTTYEMAWRIGLLPGYCHPGEHFVYGIGLTVGAAIVELIAGQRFGEYVRTHIFEPMGMRDTDFWVPPSKRERLCDFFGAEGEPLNRPTEMRHFSKPTLEDGSDGLVSTADDMMRFGRMLQNGIGIDGRQVLSSRTLQVMARNRMNILQRREIGRIPILRGYGYGLGMRVMKNPDALGVLGNRGEVGWYGHGGSWLAADPKSGITAILISQISAPVHIMTVPRFYNAVMTAFA